MFPARSGGTFVFSALEKPVLEEKTSHQANEFLLFIGCFRSVEGSAGGFYQ
jgi:hypothetical protein